MRLIDADELLRKLEEHLDKKEQDARFTGYRESEVSWDDAIYYIRTAPSAQPIMQGWVCPVCSKGLSPFVSVCPCKSGKGWEITC